MKKLLNALFAVIALGCGGGEGTISNQNDSAQSGYGLTWEAFRATKVFAEPDTGVFIADGDTPFVGEKQLREFYDLNVKEGQLIVNRIGSADDKWSDTQKLNLTYCVSNTFGTNKAAVVSAMASATGAWAGVANIKYIYVPAQDATCTATNNNVLFDVRPVNSGGQYLARSFFPSTSRSTRNVLIDGTAIGDPTVSLVGVLRHELGHTLGFRHEHTRPEAGTCFEDNNWRVLTAYDSASVMHYPQCNGTGSFTSLVLTSLDANGSAALYGAPTGGTTPPPPTTPPTSPPTTPSGPNVENFSGTLAQGASKAIGPFNAVAGTTFHAVLSGTGDADLYVRFGAAPTASTFNCRPYLDGSAEECSLTVPSSATNVFVTVTGFTAATFSLRVDYTKGTAAPAPTTGTPRTATLTGSVANGQLVQLAAVPVVPGSVFKVTMSGTGDPDLYLRFVGAPTLTLFDCRPYVGGATESCSVTVPQTANQVFIAVNGFSAGTYTLNESFVAP